MLGFSARFLPASGGSVASIIPIFIFIAATYTPLIAQLQLDNETLGLLMGVWVVAALGVALKMTLPGRFDRLSIGLCLLLGSSGVLVYESAALALPTSALWLIAIGGGLYATGVIFHLWETLRFQILIWHAFVLLAVVCHYTAIFNCVVLTKFLELVDTTLPVEPRPKGNDGRPYTLHCVQYFSEIREVVRLKKESLVKTAFSRPSRHKSLIAKLKAHRFAVGVVAALAAAAIANRYLAKKAERQNPPTGRFLDVNGIRLHYVERGTGPPLVLLHGNGSMIQDFQSSGVVDLAANKYRVIVFDRPGFGHSDRPRNAVWTPQAQADLINAALLKMGISRAIVLGHSWGALVAVALAAKYPSTVRSLVLASGYYYPAARADVLLLSSPSLPVVDDILSHTVSPLVSRLMWPLIMRKLFGPNPVPKKFEGFPEEMAVRPSQIRASAAETALLIPSAAALRSAYATLKMPVAIVAGAADRVIEIEQSAKLHRAISHSTMRYIRGNGHMIHQTATAEIMSAIDMVESEDVPDKVSAAA
jgi:pimeloyl-ACP methyl ester carboxylesterase